MSNRETDRRRQQRYRDKIKAVDSTCGNSAIDPATYKRDVPVQVWLESRHLASLSEWLDKFARTKYLSDIVADSIRVLVENLIESGEMEMVESPIEAREMLEWKYRVKLPLDRGSRGRNNARHNAVLTAKREELGYFKYKRQATNDRDIPIKYVDGRYSDEIENDPVVQKYRELERSGELDRIARKRQEAELRESADAQRRSIELSKPALENCVDVDENMRRARAQDAKLDNMP